MKRDDLKRERKRERTAIITGAKEDIVRNVLNREE